VAFFVPMMLGIPTLFGGVVALNPHRRRLTAWMLILLSGFGMTLACGRLAVFVLQITNDEPVRLVVIRLLAAMVGFCGFTLIACVVMLRQSIGKPNFTSSMGLEETTFQAIHSARETKIADLPSEHAKSTRVLTSERFVDSATGLENVH
ncbi:MAG: hypothetical protein AAF989_05245, partial [Planctomycetota bacterium]